MSSMSSIELLFIVQLRLASVPISGTLCKVLRLQLAAMEYFGIYAYNKLVTIPFVELTEDMVYGITKDIMKVFVEYNLVYHPIYTDKEISLLTPQIRRYGYKVIRYNNRLSMSR